MNSWLPLLLSAISVGLLLWLVLRRPAAPDTSAALAAKLDTLLAESRRSEAALRDELGRSASALRDEVGSRLERGFQHTLERHDAARQDQNARLDRTVESSNLAAEALRQAVDTRLRETATATEGALARHRTEAGETAQTLRSDLRQQFAAFSQAVDKALADSRTGQGAQLADFSQRLAQLQAALNEQLDRNRQTLDARLGELQAQNAAKLDEMRQTVDQRLQSTLEQRLGESFKLVGDNLERVIRSLGEMQQMAASVGDLKRVLTNVKTRGTWGEVQLAALLETILTPDQYAANVAPVPGSAERVEFAVKLPGRQAGDSPVWLPIDAKFPVEDYDRLAAAAERAEVEAVAAAAAALANRVGEQARSISTKYLAPPHTTDFGILFLVTEGLYAEVLRQPGLADRVQREHRVVIAGPSTLAALLNSLQMGFRTLAIEQRASEVWKVLGAVKTEFGKFGETLDRVQKKIDSASKELEQTGVRSRAIERKLRGVEALPAPEAAQLLPEATAVPPEAQDQEAPA